MADMFSVRPIHATKTASRAARAGAALLLSLGLSMTSVQAEPWSGKGELGLVLARGNSDADTVNAKLEMARQTDAWKNAFTLAALRSSNDGERNAERFGVGFCKS